jgi:rod shape-determining protein MreC
MGLVVVSLALLTVSFRSSALDPAEGFAASVLRPFEVAANRVAHPFRDAANWTHGLFNAKAENRKLRAENALLLRQVAQLRGADEENVILHHELRYAESPKFPAGYTEVGARVLTSPSTLDQSVTISAGRSDGIALDDVVVTNQGLVGTITKVTSDESRVTLITDPSSAVGAVDEKSLAAVGLARGTGSASLIFDRVGKDKKVGFGDEIVSAGSLGSGPYPSVYPRDLPIGYVSSVGQTDTDLFWDIQLQPFVDLSSLESVLVLIPKPQATGSIAQKHKASKR